LKAEIAALTSKVIADYQNLKQFTENISHELQSSLAIMQAKLGNFLDGSHLTDEQFQHLSSLQRDIQRLGLLNKKLVLLATLEQRQSRDFETVDLNAVTKESVENFQEISTIPITLKEKNKILVRVDKELLRVLIDNLISNAIRHSSEGGKIEIEIQDAAFTIRNSGERELENSEKIFDRFYKANPKVKVGSGLGLAIIKKVCSVFDYELSYTYEHGMHQFKVIIN
ncbi:MAG: HAMP domain-containing sensor histidine kinase, partial [Salinimicrobium sp.]